MKTYLPLFSGFYGTTWELDTELTDENNNAINYDRLKIDNDKYNRDVCFHIIDELNDELNLEFGYIKFEVDEAKRRVELFGTEWINELFTLQKIALLEAAGFEAMEFEYI